MKTFVRNFVVAGLGFALLELVTRPKRPTPAELSDRAAAAVAELVLLDAELRGLADEQPEPAPARPLCLCGCRDAHARAAAEG